MAVSLPAQPPSSPVPSDIEFDSDPMPSRISYQRQWPRIRGYQEDLEDLIWHLEAIADRASIRRYWRREGGVGQAAEYIQRERSIRFAREARDHLPLYGWVLAHELGHALDPWFGAFAPVEYGFRGMERATATYELIAEASALCCFWSFGLHVHRYEPHLLSLGGKKWQRKLFREAYNDRLWVAAGVLCKPLPYETQDQYLEADLYRLKVRRRQRRVEREIRHKCRRYGDKPAPFVINLEPPEPRKPAKPPKPRKASRPPQEMHWSLKPSNVSRGEWISAMSDAQSRLPASRIKGFSRLGAMGIEREALEAVGVELMGEDLRRYLANIGLSVDEWEQADLKMRGPRMRRMFVFSAITGLIGALLLFTGWSSLMGVLAAIVGLFTFMRGVTLKYRAKQEG